MTIRHLKKPGPIPLHIHDRRPYHIDIKNVHALNEHFQPVKRTYAKVLGGRIPICAFCPKCTEKAYPYLHDKLPGRGLWRLNTTQLQKSTENI